MRMVLQRNWTRRKRIPIRRGIARLQRLSRGSRGMSRWFPLSLLWRRQRSIETPAIRTITGSNARLPTPRVTPVFARPAAILPERVPAARPAETRPDRAIERIRVRKDIYNMSLTLRPIGLRPKVRAPEAGPERPTPRAAVMFRDRTRARQADPIKPMTAPADPVARSFARRTLWDRGHAAITAPMVHPSRAPSQPIHAAAPAIAWRQPTVGARMEASAAARESRPAGIPTRAQSIALVPVQRRLLHRAASAAPGSESQAADVVAPVQRLFRRTGREPGTGAADAAVATATSPRATGPASAPTPIGSESTPASAARAMAAPRPDAAPVMAPAMLDRLAEDVMQRIERRMRIERERRGL